MNQLDFKDRTAVITGGAVGIGFAIAQRLAASGARVSLWDRDAVALARAKSSLGVATDTRVVDVSDAASVDVAAKVTAAALSRIDVLVCSAGITGPNAPPVFVSLPGTAAKVGQPYTYESLGFEAPQITLQAFSDLIRRETDAWAGTIRSASLQLD